jgi:hypothetical protein
LTGFPDAIEQNISVFLIGSGESYCAKQISIIVHYSSFDPRVPFWPEFAMPAQKINLDNKTRFRYLEGY